MRRHWDQEGLGYRRNGILSLSQVLPGPGRGPRRDSGRVGVRSCTGALGSHRTQARGLLRAERVPILSTPSLWARGGAWQSPHCPQRGIHVCGQEWPSGHGTSLLHTFPLVLDTPTGRKGCVHTCAQAGSEVLSLCDILSECRAWSPTSGTSNWSFLCLCHSSSSSQCPAWAERAATGPSQLGHTCQVGRWAVTR